MPTIARRRSSRVIGVRALERGEQPLERGLALAAVERREGIGAAAVAAEPDPGGDPVGGEIALVGGRQRERLVVLPTLEEDAGQRDRRLGPARLELDRLAQRLLVAGGDQLVGARGHKRVEELVHPGRGDGADELVDDAPVAERLDGRDPLDP